MISKCQTVEGVCNLPAFCYCVNVFICYWLTIDLCAIWQLANDVGVIFVSCHSGGSETCQTLKAVYNLPVFRVSLLCEGVHMLLAG